MRLLPLECYLLSADSSSWSVQAEVLLQYRLSSRALAELFYKNAHKYFKSLMKCINCVWWVLFLALTLKQLALVMDRISILMAAIHIGHIYLKCRLVD